MFKATLQRVELAAEILNRSLTTYFKYIDQVVFEEFLQAFIQFQSNKMSTTRRLVLPTRALCTWPSAVSGLARLIYHTSAVVVDMTGLWQLKKILVQGKRKESTKHSWFH